jgi:N-methylhydantoinase B
VLQPGERLEVETAGGGGYGPPRQRPPERVLEDVRDGKVSAEAAREVYGLKEEET